MDEVFLPIVNDNTNISDNVGNTEIDDLAFIGNLTDDNKVKILEAVKGTSYTTNGDIIDKDNNVVLTAKDFRAKLVEEFNVSSTPASVEDIESIEIDGVEYTINDKGEAVDKDGKVIKTADEIKALFDEQNNDSNEVDLATLMQEAAVLNNFELVDDNGNPVEFEPSLEGLAKRDEFIVNKYGREIAINALDSIFDAKPELKQLYEHLELNGSVEGFSFGETKLDIQLEKDNDAQHRNIIIRAQLDKGNSQATAELIADSIINDGKGFEQAKLELAYINNKIDSINSERERALLTKRENERLSQLREIENIKNIINSGKIGNIEIPTIIKTKDAAGNNIQRNREDFIKYYASPVKDGKSQYVLDSEKMSTEEKLIEALIKFTGNDRKSLLENNVKTGAIKFIKKNRKPSDGQSVHTPSGSLDISKIKL